MRPRHRHRVARVLRHATLLVVTALLAVACGGDGAPAPPPEGEPTYPGAEDGRLSVHAEDAREDLADELGVPPEEIRIVLAEEVTWPNGALGCPQPDQAYTQALEEGYRIELEHDGSTYHYHGRQGEPPFHCPDPAPPTDAST